MNGNLTRFRVALVCAARKRKHQDAAQIAALRSDLDLDPRIEKLADLCEVVGGTSSSIERKAHLANELARDIATRKWLSAVAPAGLQTLDNASSS
jgi:hypothetical protein